MTHSKSYAHLPSSPCNCLKINSLADMPLPLGDAKAVATAAPETTLPLVFLNDFDFTEEGVVRCIFSFDAVGDMGNYELSWPRGFLSHEGLVATLMTHASL